MILTMFLGGKKKEKKNLMLEPKVDIFESHFRDYCELLISLVPFWSAIVEMVCEKRPKTF